MEEMILGMHVHTNYSDGSASFAQLAELGMKAGLDALLFSDHNLLVQGVDGYYQRGRKRLLLLCGEEVHDRGRNRPGNHMLIFGHKRELSPFASQPQRLIDQARMAAGLSFLAHPIDDPSPLLKAVAFNWEDWSVQGYTGIELWNQFSEFKTRSQSLPKLIRNLLFPAYICEGPLEPSLKLWDELLAAKKGSVVAVAGVDAHGIPVKAGPFRLNVLPYLFHFKSLRTHIFTPQRWTGQYETDRAMLLAALRAGHAFCAYDQAAPTNGFRFSCNCNAGDFIMGDRVPLGTGATLQAGFPRRAHIRLIKDGAVVLEHRDREVLSFLAREPGVYRVEAYLDYLGKHRGWIFSNPIYLI